ncbi:hypothetical protein D4764_18G0003160 [Takifugu flavidus]|uniref:Uncharacterized protein n=1 Tax=Takifugu flavidus TaxID=433684 RepID=A0A5C6NTS8_9TELE|nr:hypothetical protein D4764_18G0003160 [Takifugu flavidus]
MKSGENKAFKMLAAAAYVKRTHFPCCKCTKNILYVWDFIYSRSDKNNDRNNMKTETLRERGRF